MPPLYRLLALRYVRTRWDRAALIIASIALGVATLVSSRILNQCLQSAAASTSTPLGVGDLFVLNGGVGVRREVADDIRNANIPGVKSVQPLVVDRVTLPGLDGRWAVLVGGELSLELLKKRTDNPMKFEFHQTLEEDWRLVRYSISRRIVVLSKAVYEDWVARRGDAYSPFVVKYGTMAIDCLPIGYIEYDDQSPMAALGRNVVGMEINQAARFMRPAPPAASAALVGASAIESAWDITHPPRVNRIDVVLEKGADPAAVQATVKQVVGDRADVRTPESQGKSTQEIIDGMQAGFALCSAGAMVVGLFLVYNALSVTVAERRHDIGILRSIGATRWQIVLVFAASALILGVFGAIIGLPLGVGMARVIIGQFRMELGGMFINPEVDPGWPTPMTLALAAFAGVATAIVAALIPAIQAATQDPADAVRRTPGVAGGAWMIAHRATCATLVAGGVAMILTRHELPPRMGAFAGMLIALVGLLLAAPIIVGFLVRIAHPLLRRILPIEARLAADNLIRSPGRTGVVIGALGAGVAVMIQTAGVGRSNEEPVVEWIERVIQADRFVMAGNISEVTSSSTPIAPGVVREMGRVPGVQGVVGVRYCQPEYNGTRVFVLALDAAEYADCTEPRAGGGLGGYAALRSLPGAERALISENFAVKHGVRVGDTLTLPGPKGPVRLHVAGTVTDFTWARGTVIIDRSVYARLFQDELVDICHVYLAGGGSPTDPGIENLSKFASDKGLFVLDRQTVRKGYADIIDKVYVVAFLQQIVVGIVAALGVVTSLLISVLQRRRELGLLLAVGATPNQVIRTVLAEAVLMGVFGTILGILIGLPLEWYVLRVVLVEESGFVFDLLIPWRQTATIAVGAITIATLAGLLPALHAVRMRITDAIAHQ